MFTSITDTVSDAPLATYARFPTTATPFGSEPTLIDVVVPTALATVTVTAAEVVVLPAASRATAVMRVAAVAHRGGVPRQAVGRGGVLGAQIDAVHLELHPSHPDIVGGGGAQGHRARHGRARGGPVRLTVGAVVSLSTVTLTAAEVVVLPAASRARAVSVWAPLVAVVVFHDTP